MTLHINNPATAGLLFLLRPLGGGSARSLQGYPQFIHKVTLDRIFMGRYHRDGTLSVRFCWLRGIDLQLAKTKPPMVIGAKSVFSEGAEPSEQNDARLRAARL
jgi:hypothetical protein